MTLAPEVEARSSWALKSVLPIGNVATPSTLPPFASITAVAAACSALPKLKSTVRKNQASPPSFTTCRAVIVVIAWTSSAQWVLYGLHSLLVNSVMAAAVIITVRCFSFATSCTASATGVTGRSVMASTPPLSNQSRASAEATSGLFSLSPNLMRTGSPSTTPPKSATAMRAASSDPRPPLSPYGPEASVSTPTVTGSGFWARARSTGTPASAAAPSNVRQLTPSVMLI